MAIQVSSHSFTGQPKYRFDVFLSFRGEDTRHSFTVPLYDALRRKGINAFIDDKKLGKGERIVPALLKAIERSRISIIVFSSNYATSTWCLDELAHIMWCKNEKNQLVMPIFYKVDPMAVQYQKDSFEAAMAAHEDTFRDHPEKVQKWKSALSEAASLSKAWLFEDGYEIGFIERIVKDACAVLPPKHLHSIGYTVGLERRVEEVISLLNQSDERVCMLGIHGIGGIGKTTLAKSVYNSIFYQFEGACFLSDVKEASKKYQGIVCLQQKLLSEILEEKIMKIGSVDKGISRIKHRLSKKKVLLVLDDVDEAEQLEQLAGQCDWFGCESRVIITTRNKQVLIARNVEKTYEMIKLNEYDSCELFCWYAFHMNQPPKTYQEMFSCVISYAQGLPLALRVIGSNLANKNLEEWSSILEQYEGIQERTIHDILKISYDCLQAGAKRIFLDIACFTDKEMLGSIKDIARFTNKEVLGSIKESIQACDFGDRFCLEVLVDKSLITLAAAGDYIIMHDLIRQMGREIVRQEAPLNPEKRSRLWYYEDVLKGCNNNEGIMLDPPHQKKVKWSGMAFEKMNNLRILVVRNVQFSTAPAYLPNSLRWLEWEGYPSTTLPRDFSPSELMCLKLTKSPFRLKGPLKIFTSHVTQLDFSFCEFITELPDMSQCQCLRRLDLRYCDNLIKVHDSLGSLSKLIKVDFRGCTKLSIFPREIKMASLKTLFLEGCTSLEHFPHVVGKMDALDFISIEGTAIKELPPSIGNLSGLQELFMRSCYGLRELPTSLFMLPNLETFGLDSPHPYYGRKYWMKLMQDIQPIISSCYMKSLSLEDLGLLDEDLHLILNNFRNLGQLDLSRNDFVSLPKCIKECTNLWRLAVNDCKRLRDIPELPSKSYMIEARNCTSLTAESLDNLYSQAKKELIMLRMSLPAVTTFPDWFHCWSEGGTLSFRVRGNFPSFLLAFELAGKANMSRKQDFPIFINGGFFQFREEERKRLNNFIGSDWNDVEIQPMTDSPGTSVVKCGVYFYKETNMENVQFKSSHASTASLKQRAMISLPNFEPPKKLLRTDQKRKTQ
ncbi:TMV resistance protein N-like [Neltuma alba]|uniref:TMV resistance protein N-like n=1 Tax=Neltuma alba TaxID=207710 RepID=UPI0010A4D987|nr:TMV resistance protein N-like [Prosopis alba]